MCLLNCIVKFTLKKCWEFPFWLPVLEARPASLEYENLEKPSPSLLSSAPLSHPKNHFKLINALYLLKFLEDKLCLIDLNFLRNLIKNNPFHRI